MAARPRRKAKGGATPHRKESPKPSPGKLIEVVGMVASAGGFPALTAVLRGLPRGFTVAVVVVQHLSGETQLVRLLAARTLLPVSWAVDGEPIHPGRITVCPGGSRLEVLPDRTISLSSVERCWRDRRLDHFLESLAGSFGPHALGVVLTGMGTDGSLGARKLKDAGGTVFVQSEDTAEAPSMPRAAIKSGAADLVLPLDKLGKAIGRVIADHRLPRPRTEIEARQALRQSERRLERDVADTKELQEISSTPIEGEKAGAIYDKIVEAARKLMRSEAASIQLLEPEALVLLLLAWRGFHPEAAAYWERLTVKSDSVCAAAFKAGRRIIYGDVEAVEELRGTRTMECYQLCGLRSVQSTPLMTHDGRMLGMLSTLWSRPHEPEDRELALLDLLARQAADVLERNQAQEVLRASEARLTAELAGLRGSLRPAAGSQPGRDPKSPSR